MKSVIMIFVVLMAFGCHEKSKVQATLTELDKLLIQADTSPIEEPLQIVQSVNKEIKEKWPTVKEYVSPLEATIDTTGVIKHRFYSGTLNKKNINVTVVAYKTPKQATNAFVKYINNYKCCIPEEDMMALKNFKDLKTFKLGTHTIIYSDNTIATMILGKKIGDNQDFNLSIEKYFNSEKSKKLETEDNGPAVWTKR